MQTLAFLLGVLRLAQAAQPSAPQPVAAPIRPLPWKQLNFLHTTDVHGWYGGHLQEPSFSADWGDYISFIHHLQTRADEDGVDLLLIDTGDRVEGNGLYDASNPKGKYIFDIIKQQQMDVISCGNHELYQTNASYAEYYTNIPNFGGKYLASNIDIFDRKKGEYIPLAPRFRKFRTKNQGIRIMAFGFLFDFDWNSNSTRVQSVEDAVKEDWFKEAIRDEAIDLFLVTGHSAMRSQEFNVLFEVIRKQRWDTPIAFFGGHQHIRDFKVFDDKAAGMASGRYLETIGFMSVDGITTAGSKSLKRKPRFDRLYIDNNLYSLHYHAHQNDSTFSTGLGKNVSRMIAEAREKLNLDQPYGCAPKDYWVNRAKVDGEDSIFRLLGERILPESIAENKKHSTPKMILSNTGAIRFDIFKGPVTIDTTFLISPFQNGFNILKDVPYGIAAKLLDVLNSENKLYSSLGSFVEPRLLLPPVQDDLEGLFRNIVTDVVSLSSTQVPLEDKPELIPGYTTQDDLGSDGDDTKHSYIQFYNVPNCFQTLADFPKDSNTPVPTLDLVFNEFIQPFLLRALEFLGSTRYANETEPYLDGKSFTDIFSDWIKQNWPCNDKEEL